MQRDVLRHVCKTAQKVFSLLRKTCNDGDDRTDSGKLFQTDAAVVGKVRSPMVKRTVRGATSADVVCHLLLVINNNLDRISYRF